MSAERGGWIADLLSGGGVGDASKSVGRCPRKIDIVRMKALAHLGVNFHTEFYGDTMRWDDLASVGLYSGVNTMAVTYPRLEPGWAYEYDAVGGVFTVTDQSGNVTRKRIGNLSEMGIVAEILVSHQFRVYYSARFINDAFLVAWIKRRNQGIDGGLKDDTVRQQGYILSYVDQFFSETMPWRCGRMGIAAFLQPEPENNIEQDLQDPADEPEVLCSKSPARAATGDYSDMAIKGPGEKTGRIDKNRNAIVDVAMGEMVMVAAFASLTHMSKPVYEPWMLWELWKWLGSGELVELVEKIFDLSPRW